MDNVIDEIIAKPISVVTVNDGWVFSFSTEILEALLRRSQKTGKVMVLVKKSEETKP